MQNLSHHNSKLLLISHLLLEQQMVNSVLSSHGYEVHKATRGCDGLRLLFQIRPDLVLFDFDLPDITGAALYSRVRHFSDVPIVILGELVPNRQQDAFPDSSSTTYVTKPLQPVLLLTQVQQLLSQYQFQQSQPSTIVEPVSTDVDTELILDHRQYQLYSYGQPNSLSAAEYQLLVYFIKNAGQILTHNQILGEVWGARQHGALTYLYTLIWRLRCKIERNLKAPQHLLSHYSLGYSFEGSILQIF